MKERPKTREAVRELLVTMVAEQLDIIDESAIKDTDRFDDLGADSLDRVELAIAVEEELIDVDADPLFSDEEIDGVEPLAKRLT